MLVDGMEVERLFRNLCITGATVYNCWAEDPVVIYDQMDADTLHYVILKDNPKEPTSFVFDKNHVYRRNSRNDGSYDSRTGDWYEIEGLDPVIFVREFDKTPAGIILAWDVALYGYSSPGPGLSVVWWEVINDMTAQMYYDTHQDLDGCFESISGYLIYNECGATKGRINGKFNEVVYIDDIESFEIVNDEVFMRDGKAFSIDLPQIPLSDQELKEINDRLQWLADIKKRDEDAKNKRDAMVEISWVEGFYAYNDEVYHHQYTYLPGVDKYSLQTINSCYAKDKSHVILHSWDVNAMASLIQGADAATFKPISTGYSCIYAKDKRNIYYLGDIVVWADPQSFTIITGAYAKDKRSLFWRKGKIAPLAEDLKILYSITRAAMDADIEYSYVQNGWKIYFRGKLVEGIPESISLSDSTISVGEYGDVTNILMMAKEPHTGLMSFDTNSGVVVFDNNKFYEWREKDYYFLCNEYRLDINRESLQIYGHGYFKDKNNVYNFCKKIEWADATTFTVYNGYTYADKYWRYEYGALYESGRKPTEPEPINPIAF